MIRTMIAEDEPLARDKLRALIADETDLTLVGEAEDGISAVQLVDELKPDLLFLDVHMPGLSGMGALEQIRHHPSVVFTTAHDQYALAAFELAALDYLLKPFSQDRFREALARVRRLMTAPATQGALERAGETLGTRPLTRIFVRDRDAIRPIAVRDADRFEARDDYVAVFARGKTYLLNVSMQKLEERLPPEQFVRIHRSHIINLDRIAALHAHDAARMLVEMTDGSRVVASRSGTQRLRELAL
jgi:two-component system, LytTR family, response regulator